jgi:hypothetical protein
MLQSEFKELKIGDKVTFNGVGVSYDVPVGEVMTRTASWLDCSATVRFDHTYDWDFFAADQVELIKE